MATSDDAEATELPRQGDRVEHPVFGLCEVMVLRGERLKMRHLDGPPQLREIHLGAMKLLKPVTVDGRRVFKLVKRG